MKSFNLLLICCLFILTACFKDDEMIPGHESGNEITASVEMSATYKYQVFFDLSTNSVAGYNDKAIWDLAFESADTGMHILLNTANYMWAANTGDTAFYAIKDTAGYEWNFDPSDGNLNELAIGSWVDVSGPTPVYTNQVYIINRGVNDQGVFKGFKKVVFQEFNKDNYIIRFADLSGANEILYTINKDKNLNFTAFSFNNNSQIMAFEPDKESWDLLFTQYTTTLLTDEGDEYPYLVTGVFINPNKVIAQKDTILSFSEIDFQAVNELTFSNRKDIIGYEWKAYDFDIDAYYIIPGTNYLIKDTDLYIYKLRFIDFYNDIGTRGYPTFEFQQL